MDRWIGRDRANVMEWKRRKLLIFICMSVCLFCEEIRVEVVEGEDQKFLLQAFSKKLMSMVFACLYTLSLLLVVVGL